MQALKRHEKMLNKANSMVKQIEGCDTEFTDKLINQLNQVYDKYSKMYPGPGQKRGSSKFNRKDRI